MDCTNPGGHLLLGCPNFWAFGKVRIFADINSRAEAHWTETKTMFWWLKLRLNSPDGVVHQRVVNKLCALLEHHSEDQQHKAAVLLATIGHPSAVRCALQYVTNRDCAELGVRLLEQIITDFPNAVEADSLERLAALDDPLQKIATPPLTWGGRQYPANWENYRAVNCSALREKAAVELQRRAEAEAQWRAADEEERQKRQATIPVVVERRTA
jgi:hypothetical protein